jgi:flagellar hook protein FlgE
LESSNVDLTGEFSNLIVAQRAFQANARMITTSDQMMQEIVALKR